jgi:hypothetical protein
MEEIEKHLNQYDLDIRKKPQGYSRFMDQKVTPDVLSFICDCILNFVNTDPGKSFTIKDIWESGYFESNIKAIFNKPSPSNATTKAEYDKFIAQPLKTLSYAKVLNEDESKRTNTYTINNYDLLEYISLKERNAFNFLYQYIYKVLSDSGFIKELNNYKDLYSQSKLDRNAFNDMKARFQRFIIGNTNINTDIEVNRIYPKILNIYAVQNQLPGTVDGRLSDHPFTYSELMYNDINFRDIKKSKGMSRQEAIQVRQEESQQKEYGGYRITKAMALIKRKYSESEVKDKWATGSANQVHHIFPQSQSPELAHYTENLIKLTPTQHFTNAHSDAHTHKINKDYQLTCLLAKSHSIEQSINSGEFIYSKESFIHVLNKGLNIELSSDLTFEQLRKDIPKHF